MACHEITESEKLKFQKERMHQQFSDLCDEEFSKIEHAIIDSANEFIDSMSEKIKERTITSTKKLIDSMTETIRERIEEKKGEAIAGVIIHLDKHVRMEDGVGVTTISIQKQ